MKKTLSLFFLLLIPGFNSLSFADCVITIKSGNVRSGPSTKHEIIKHIREWEIISYFSVEGSWVVFEEPEVVNKDVKNTGWTFWDPGCYLKGMPCDKPTISEKAPIILLNSKGEQTDEPERVGVIIGYTGKERSEVKMWSRGWGDYRSYCAEVIYHPIGPKRYFIHKSLVKIIEGSKKDAERYIKIRKSGFSKKIQNKLIEKKVWIGMTKEMAILSWGNPDDINQTITANVVREQWVYEGGRYKGQYIYFENGKLIAIQTH